MKYSIVIPTYNHCDDLLKPCLESIFKYTNVSDIELIISANGCNDNTFEYLGALKEKYNYLGLSDNLKIVWNFSPLGYARATNEGIKLATTDLIVLLNNDVILLEQTKNQWLEILATQFNYPKCGISCLIKGPSEPAGHDFAIFFCVMIHRKVFDKIGLLPLDYGVGGGEDTEFSIECERAGFEVREAVAKSWSNDVNLFTGNFPIYHKGEGTVHDTNLVPNWGDIFLENSLKLAKKYNPSWYQWRLSNYWERAVFFKGDPIAPREITRYTWAAQNILGNTVFELGCSSGYGVQFLPENVQYTGLDYDSKIVEVAKEQQWRPNVTFVHGDINSYEMEHYDTIIAYEVIEHLDNGLEIVEKLKKHCDRLIISVPMLETPGLWGPHHKLHNLDESFFPGFRFKFIAPDGTLQDEPHLRGDKENINLMLCIWDKNVNSNHVDLSWLKTQNEEIYNEVIVDNCYNVSANDFVSNTAVIDIGANIGAFSLLAAKLGATKVVAVEPVKSTHDMLLNNIKQSGFNNIISVKNLVSNYSGREFNISLNVNNGHNSMFTTANDYETVTTVTLADLLTLVGNDEILLKIDCEGAEYDIILDASIRDMQRVRRIVIEVHADLHPIYKGFDILNNKLKSFGFTKTDEKQIYSWEIDQYGNAFNHKPIPCRVEMWSR